MISYCVTVCNEREEIEKLLTGLTQYISVKDEILILFDQRNGSSDTEQFLDQYVEDSNRNGPKIYLRKESFDNDFAAWKNLFFEAASNPYIFNIDADELPHETLLQMLPKIVEHTNLDLLYVPRINIVNGMTRKDIHDYNWTVNDQGWVQFPDYQSRIYKSNAGLYWEGKVHETIKGFEKKAFLPAEEHYCLYHIKDIERQRRQNAFYDTLSR